MNELKAKLVTEMKQYFDKDEGLISHALRVTEFAEEILKEETGDSDVVIAAAILHDIGIPEAEQKYNSSAGHYQEIEGPPIAREILAKHDLDENFIAKVCEIVGNHHSPKKVNTDNFRAVYDADWLVNLNDVYKHKNKEELARIIEKVFLTPTGKRVAKKINNI